MEKLYTAFREQRFETGKAQIVLTNGQEFDVDVYRRHVVGVKLPSDAISKAVLQLTANLIRQVRVQEQTIEAAAFSPMVVQAAFAACFRELRSQPDAARRFADSLRLLAMLAKQGDKVAGPALSHVSRELTSAEPTFSSAAASVISRWKQVCTDAGIGGLPPFDATSTDAEVIQWAVGGADALGAGPVSENILHFAFTGKLLHRMVSAKVRKEGGLGAKAGSARASKALYEAKAGGQSTARFFIGAKELGTIPVAWASLSGPEFMLTKADLDRLQLKDGDSVSVVFSS